jgi:hypothetical protein
MAMGDCRLENKTDISQRNSTNQGKLWRLEGWGPMEPRMSRHEAQASANWLLAFAMIVGGALGVALPMASLFIVWICS